MVRVWLRGLWIESQAGLNAESLDEFGPVLDALEQPLGARGELVDGPDEQVAQVAFDVCPDALGGVELRGVGRQLDHGQPVVVRVAEPAHRGAAVHVEIVPNQDDRSLQLGVRGGDQPGVVIFGEAAPLAGAAAVHQDPVEQPGTAAGPVADQRGHRDPPASARHRDLRGVPAGGPGARLLRAQGGAGLVPRRRSTPRSPPLASYLRPGQGAPRGDRVLVALAPRGAAAAAPTSPCGGSRYAVPRGVYRRWNSRAISVAIRARVQR